MKKILSVLLVLAMALTAVAYAETAAINPVETVLTDEEKLTRMLPVLDAVIDTMGIEGEVPYTAEDASLVWNVLIAVATNERETNPLILSDDALMIVPKSVMLEYAAASFFGMTELPEIPADPATVDMSKQVAYDEVTETYRVVLEQQPAVDPAAPVVKNETVVEHYGVDADGDLTATVALYNVDETTKTETRLGALRVKLTVNPLPGTVLETALPLSVEEAAVEGTGFFTDPMVAEYDCRLVYPTETPVEPAVTPAPTATPAPEAPKYASLQQGSRGDSVKALQERLNKLGYDSGKADGIYGSRTANAVRYFQNAVGMTETGKATSAVQEKLFAQNAPEFVEYVLLKKGDSGIRVENLQKKLRKLGYLAEPVDGVFGSRTQEAVKLFQDAAGLDTDGIAGKKTLKALDSKKAPECEVYITLKKGDTGDRVTELQDKLVELGLLEKASGVYDKKTVAAVKAFIDANGLTGNGKTADAKLVETIMKATKPVLRLKHRPLLRLKHRPPLRLKHRPLLRLKHRRLLRPRSRRLLRLRSRRLNPPRNRRLLLRKLRPKPPLKRRPRSPLRCRSSLTISSSRLSM